MSLIPDLDNKTKPWDEQHLQLFHRINSDAFDKDRDPASGDGYKAGGRSVKDFKEDSLSDLLANGVLVAVENALTGLLPAIITNLLKQFSSAAGNALQQKIDEINDAIAKLIASTLEGLVFGKFIRSIPAWVPVERQLTPIPDDEKDEKKLKAAVDKNKKEREDFEKTAKENEIEGRLTGSYQLPRGIPFLQWNRWFNWAFDVSPILGYGYMVGKGNVRDQPEDDALNPPDANDTLSPATDVNEGRGHSMQCLMDFGAFSKTPGEVGDKLFASGPMFQNGWPFWPTCGDYFWASGRWVYDCNHISPTDDKDKGRMPTQLHPVKAFACARYEGFKFDENERPVAAVRFLFFATKRGGYLNFGAKDKDVADDECGVKINTTDYEFILDLPESPPVEDIKWPIGHSPVTDANTLVLRPSLLIDVKFAPFDVDTGTLADLLQFDKTLKPKVQLLKPPDAEKPTQQQVKISIPLTNFDASKDAYGVCISLGWFDPTGELADRVKRIEMRFDGIKYFDSHSDVRLNLAANGRWVHHGLLRVPAGKEIDNISQPGFLLFVPDDGIVQMAAHSTQMNGFGRFEEDDNDEDRTLHVGGIFRTPEDLRKKLEDAKKQGLDKIVTDGLGKISTDFLGKLSQEAFDLLTGKREVVKWKEHVDQPDSDIASAVAREMFAKLPPLFNDQNEPLGMVEPSPNPLSVRGPVGDNSPGENPVLMRDIVKKVNESSPQRFGFTFNIVPKLESIGDADKLAFHDSRGGTSVFQLRVELNVSNQPDPS